jgi:hypothetical protein
MFLGRGVPSRSPRRGRRKAYPYEIQNLFLKDYSIPSTSPFGKLRKFSGRSLSGAERSGARIEGCGLAQTRRVRRTLRYDLRYATVYSGCLLKSKI